VNLKAYALGWAIFAGAVVVLAIYRLAISKGERIVLHVRDSETALVPEQTAMIGRIERVEKWGKFLTILAVVFGLVLLAAWIQLKLQQWG
jgi:hypothetical protein